MGDVVISPNIKKAKVSIDIDGNEVVPFTHQVIKANKPDFVPTPEDLKKITNPKPLAEAPKTPQVESSGGIADIIRNKVQEAVKAEISKIDIGSMVAKAISDALK